MTSQQVSNDHVKHEFVLPKEVVHLEVPKGKQINVFSLLKVRSPAQELS